MLNKTPLRYPGGKTLMASLFIDMFEVNHLEHITYAEPYAGGAGTAISLLLDNKVERIIINDANVGIYSFWNAIINEKEKFIDLIQTIPVNLKEWNNQHSFFINNHIPSFELGFSTFYLSRTNRSGILNAGPIGGSTELKQDSAKYKIDCRFNRDDLVDKITCIANRKNDIIVRNKDAIQFLKDLKGKDKFIYLDPPYYVNGKSLYMDYYKKQDHAKLAEYLKDTTKFKWVLSYDNVSEIRELYNGYDLYEFNLKYTANVVKSGAELLTYSKDLLLPDSHVIRRKERNVELNKI